AEKRPIPADEGEHGHGGGHADVDADHAALDFAGELAGGGTAGGEDSRSIAVTAAIGPGDGVFEGLGPQKRKDRAQDLLVVAARASGPARSSGVGPTKKPGSCRRERPSRMGWAPSPMPRSMYLAARSLAAASMTGPMWALSLALVSATTMRSMASARRLWSAS